MPRDRLVAVSYPVDDEYARINTDVLGDEASVSFLQRVPEPERPSILARAEALVAWNLRRELPDGALERAPGLRFIQLLSAGADSVDFRTIPEAVPLAGNVGAYAKPMAEHVMAMVLALIKRLPQRHPEMARGEFNQSEPLLTLDGAVCAIVGFGGIGSAAARLMRPFGARIYALNTSGKTNEDVDFIGTLADLDEVLAAADVLLIALPLTNTTRKLIGTRELALMKDTAVIVNVARGAIIDEQALYKHLVAKPDFCAALDAWWHEPRGGKPFTTEYAFFDLPNVLGSPHNSGVVAGVLPAAAAQAAENVRRYLRGEPVTGVMNRADYL
jgi:glycerate dehydrogenase